MDRKSLILDKVFLLLKLCLGILKSENLGVINWQVLIWVPVAVLERLDTSVFLESFPSILEWSIDLIWEIHVISVSSLHISMFLMLLRNLVFILLEMGVNEVCVTLFVADEGAFRLILLVVTSNDRDLHVVEHVLKVFSFLLLLIFTLVKGLHELVVVQLFWYVILFHLVIAALPSLSLLDIIFSQVGLLSCERIWDELHLIVVSRFAILQLIDNLTPSSSWFDLIPFI